MLRFIPLLFGLFLAQFVWHAWHKPTKSKHFVGGRVEALHSGQSDDSGLYLRHTFYAGDRPQFGWIRILGRSQVKLYINGQIVTETKQNGFDVAVLVDVAPYLRSGRNVIAISSEHSPSPLNFAVAKEATRPLLAIEGAYESGGHLCALDDGSVWRCSAIPELRNHWWFESDFSDAHWPIAKRSMEWIRASVELPPRAITEQSEAHWIGPRSMGVQRCTLRRAFQVSGTVESAWLRLTSNAAFRLAVNGVIIDVQEDVLASQTPPDLKRWIYDLTPLLSNGENTLAVAITGAAVEPRILADLEARGESFGRLRINTDENWRWQPDVAPGWIHRGRTGDTVFQEAGHPFGAPWTIETKKRALVLPPSWMIRQACQRVALSFCLAILCWGACCLMRHVCQWMTDDKSFAAVVCLAFVLPLAGLSIAILATFDPRVNPASMFTSTAVVLAIVSVVGQWLLLVAILSLRRTTVSFNPWGKPVSQMVTAGTLLLVVLGGFLVRYSQISVKPLQHDEASALRSTQGLFERGFPSRQIHPEVPTKYVETSELVYFCAALTTLIFDDDLHTIRFPAVCWGSAAVFLLWFVGKRMFGAPVGFIAAATYAISPICIQMACFGRYFTQLQFFCLLTFYFFWCTVRGNDTIQRRYLCYTALSFLAMYFTWQGSALLAPGLAAGCIWTRRKSLHAVVLDRSVWLALVTVGCIVALHMSMRSLHLVQFLTYGTGISNLSPKSMWKLPDFDITFCVWESAWNRDALFHIFGVLGACLTAVRHPFRRSIRFLLLAYLTTCFLQSLLLPVYTWRYSFHLMPFAVLLFAATLFAVCRALVPRQLSQRGFHGLRAYAKLIATTTAVIVLIVASGSTIQLRQLHSAHIHTYELPDLRFADLAGATAFLQSQRQEGDTVLASNPHVVDHFLGIATTDYWPQSRFYIQAVLDDSRSVPLHRIAGTAMLSSRQELQELFSRKTRIWYVLVPSRHDSQNTAEVSSFLRQNMRIAYKGDRVLVLVRDGNNRTAAKRIRDDRRLVEAEDDYLTN